MRIPFGFIGGKAAVSPCTIPSNWGSGTCSNSPGNCSVTSSAKILTVPVGNTGTLLFNIASAHTCQYSKNSGAFTAFTDGQTVIFANGDTIALKILGLAPGFDTDTITVKDNTTLSSIGTATGTNNHA